VGVKSTGMGFAANNPDYTTCGGSITDNNQKVTFSKMNGTAGQEVIYMPVNITCADAGGHNIALVLDSWTGASQTHLYYINVTMFNGATQKGNSILLYPTGKGTSVTTSGTVNIANGETWNVKWRVYWAGNATLTDKVEVYLLLSITS
jgi:hypothetical protein